MNEHNTRQEFAPPAQTGNLRALGLAIVAHAVLVAVLTLGVQWKHDAPISAIVAADLWSSVSQQAAPPAPPPEPTPPPPTPVHLKPIKPVERPTPPPTAQPTVPRPDPSIVLAREKERLKKEQAEKDRLEQEKKAKLERERLAKEQQKKEDLKAKQQQEAKLEREKLEREKQEREKKTQREEAAKAAAERKKLDEMREQNLRRMAGLAAGTGDNNSTGTASKSSGPSAGYAVRISARIKPNITFTDTVATNPAAEVEVRTAPDGTILSRKLVKSSGIKAWDDAVLNAIDKTESLPRDTDGRVPSPMTVTFRPKD
jgi:colicin import membrane protein